MQEKRHPKSKTSRLHIGFLHIQAIVARAEKAKNLPVLDEFVKRSSHEKAQKRLEWLIGRSRQKMAQPSRNDRNEGKT